MGRTDTLGSRSFRLPSRRRKPTEATGSGSGLGGDVNGTGTDGGFAAFRAQTFLHVDAVYSDALCLTGNVEEAADLVVESYTRAFQQYEQFRRRHAPSRLRERDTLAWLYGNMHAAFCGRVLARANHTGMPAGDRP